MRRSKVKFIAWLLVGILGLNPLLGVFAIDATKAECQIEQMANITVDSTAHAAEDHMLDCTQHHACTSYCQFAPLQPSDLSLMQLSRRPLSTLAGEPDHLVTRFLEGIERPPRV